MEQENNLQPSQFDASPFSDLLSNLLSNPEMMEKIRAIAEQLPSVDSQNQTSIGTATSPSDGLTSVLSDPQMMAKLPQMMAMIGPLLGASSDTAQTHRQEKTAEICRNDLLLALKPFLSPERCRAIDTMLRIAKLGNVIRQIK